MRIFSLDLSLTATGYAVAVDGKLAEHGVLREGKPVSPESRLVSLRDRVMDISDRVSPELVVIEGPSFGSNDPSMQDRAGLAGILRVEFYTHGIPFFLPSPSQLKKFCCGTGGAKKEQVMKDLLARFGHNINDNNEADSIVLAYIGMAAVGEWQPTIEAQREVLEKVLSSNPLLRKFTANLK